MATTFIYSIANDMPNGAVSTNSLLYEIEASDITASVDQIDTDNDALTIVFSTDLTSGEETILDGDTSNPAGGLLAAHKEATDISNGSQAYRSDALKTSSNSYATYVSLLIDDLAAGNYKVSWYAEIAGSNKNAQYLFRIYRKESDKDITEITIQPTVSRIYYPISGFTILEGFLRGPIQLDAQIKVDNKRTAAIIKNAVIELKKIDMTDDSSTTSTTVVKR